MEFKADCDICGGPFTTDDLSDPKGVVRLNPNPVPTITGTSVIVGFGSGCGTWFVHRRCLVTTGKKVGTLRGFGDAN